MRALIFNSGLGSRLGALTAKSPKAMVRLGNGETIFGRQLRLLSSCGVTDFVVTTGPYPEQLRGEAERFERAGCTFEFVPNDAYGRTNYIYSMYLARRLLRGRDLLLLHGDLVFDAPYAQAVLDSPLPSLGSVNPALPLPEKDFKARLAGGMVREVSVSIRDGGCVAFQPFYKLSGRAVDLWLDGVERLVGAGDVGVYAENAANPVLREMGVAAFSYEGHLVEEVDTPEDLARVSRAIREFDFAQQPVFEAGGDGVSLLSGSPVGPMRGAASVADVLRASGLRRPLVVSGSHFEGFPIKGQLEEAGIGHELFSGFSANPTREQVEAAAGAFVAAGCDSLLSVGGGSAIDVAKCVKAVVGAGGEGRGGGFPDAPVPYSPVPHVAVPTTAGTGSESTRFAVCYAGGRKVSVAQDCLLPDAAVLDASVLAGLPEYQKKCTLLDALCQAIESHWSVSAVPRSREYSGLAISGIVGHWRAYLAGDPGAARAVLAASNLAGRAINLTTTTAAHAMSYGLTSLYGLPHGHAVAMCMPHVWRLLLGSPDGGTRSSLDEVAGLMAGGKADAGRGPAMFEQIMNEMEMPLTVEGREGDVEDLVSSVNAERLSNFPLALDGGDLERAYRKIVLT